MLRIVVLAAIVTGASRGMGAAIALELAKRGAKVALTFASASSEQAVDETVAQINGLDHGAAATKIQADLHQPDGPKKIVAETRVAFGGAIDILVNNAGCAMIKLLPDVTADEYAYCMDLHVRGALFTSQAVLPHLCRPGRIINMSSIGARVSIKAGPVYLTSKAALEGLSRALAAKLGAQGHAVNAIEPGPTRSDMLDKIPPELVELQTKLTPLENRVGEPQDIALLTAMVAEPQSGWMTGKPSARLEVI